MKKRTVMLSVCTLAGVAVIAAAQRPTGQADPNDGVINPKPRPAIGTPVGKQPQPGGGQAAQPAREAFPAERGQDVLNWMPDSWSSWRVTLASLRESYVKQEAAASENPITKRNLDYGLAEAFKNHSRAFPLRDSQDLFVPVRVRFFTFPGDRRNPTGNSSDELASVFSGFGNEPTHSFAVCEILMPPDQAGAGVQFKLFETGHANPRRAAAVSEDVSRVMDALIKADRARQYQRMTDRGLDITNDRYLTLNSFCLLTAGTLGEEAFAKLKTNSVVWLKCRVMDRPKVGWYSKSFPGPNAPQGAQPYFQWEAPVVVMSVCSADNTAELRAARARASRAESLAASRREFKEMLLDGTLYLEDDIGKDMIEAAADAAEKAARDAAQKQREEEIRRQRDAAEAQSQAIRNFPQEVANAARTDLNGWATDVYALFKQEALQTVRNKFGNDALYEGTRTGYNSGKFKVVSIDAKAPGGGLSAFSTVPTVYLWRRALARGVPSFTEYVQTAQQAQFLNGAVPGALICRCDAKPPFERVFPATITLRGTKFEFDNSGKSERYLEVPYDERGDILDSHDFGIDHLGRLSGREPQMTFSFREHTTTSPWPRLPASIEAKIDAAIDDLVRKHGWRN